jgi:hypothetical protein
MLTVRPLAVSAAACRVLARGQPVVRAGHRHGATVAVAGCDDELFLSGPAMGLFPLHVVLRTGDLRHILAGAGQAGSGGRPIAIATAGVRTVRLQLTADPASLLSARARRNLAAVGRWLRASPVPLGLGLTPREVLGPGSLLAQLGGSPPATGFLRRLIGRGGGSTPAGDDMLIGALAFAWAAQGQASPLVSAVAAFALEFPALTGSTGATYLRAAMRGEFGSHLISFVRGLARTDDTRALALAARVSRHGVTSGFDTLTGFVAAAEAGGCKISV